MTGGARSGKSHFAQEMAQGLGRRVLFVATAEPGDEEMRERIEQHKRARPPSWETLEVTSEVGRHVTQQIKGAEVVIIDCITLLVNNLFNRYLGGDEDDVNTQLLDEKVTDEIGELIDCMDQADATFIIVTNEVGLGIVPDNKIARLYRDLLGKANQLLAERAEQVFMMVSGIALPLK
jgi:adenosylcobinamide kinase/adenosylcobinamide-phosphate guanylyltransferase